MTISTQAKYLLIDLPLKGSTWALLCALPGYKKWKGRQLLARPTGENIRYLLTHFPDVEWSAQATVHRQAYLDIRQEEENILKDKQQQPQSISYQFKTTPYQHQQKAFSLSCDTAVFALLMEQGCGKTKVIIDNATYLYLKHRIRAVIVIAPNGVHQMWPLQELPAHSPIPYSRYIYYPTDRKQQQQQFQQCLKSQLLQYYFFNVEGFVSARARQQLELILKTISPVMMVIDEGSRIKNPSAQRTRYLIRQARSAQYRRLLTGTPVTNGLENLYSQFSFLDPLILGYDSYYTFRAAYCIMGGWENKAIVAYQNTQDLYKKIHGHSYQITKKECLDLPQKIYKQHIIELTPRQHQLYQQLKTEYIAEFNNQLITAELAIVRMLRLQQIICGWFPADDEHRPQLQPIDKVNARLKALLDLLDDYPGKMIIWARFRADLLLLEQSLPNHVSYHGSTSPSDRKQAIQQFQQDRQTRFFISNPQTGGMGLTLTAAKTVVYYSNSFSLEHRLQSEDRCHRIGLRHPVVYIDLEARGTIDRYIVRALQRKENIAKQLRENPISMFTETEEE